MSSNFHKTVIEPSFILPKLTILKINWSANAANQRIKFSEQQQKV